jgi:hypothetical protein
MAIQVRCPSGDCGKLLSVPDEYAGKTGKCPVCGAVLPIPALDEAGGRNAPSPAAEPRYADDRGPAPARRPRRRREEEEEDDYHEEDRPRRRSRYDEPPRRRRGAEGGLEVSTVVLLAIGTALMFFLSFIPLFSYASSSGSAGGMAAGPSQASPSLFKGDELVSTWQGKVILIVSLVVSVLALTSLILYLTINPGASDLILTIIGSLVGGWAMAVLLWLVGFVWKVLTLSSKVNELMQNRGFGVQFKVSITPGIGLWIGMGVALAVVVIFSTLMSIRQKTLWIYLGEGVGLLLGVLMMTVAVQPWKTPMDNPAGPAMPRPGFMQHVPAGQPARAIA